MPLAQPMVMLGCVGVIALVLLLTAPIWVKGLMFLYRGVRSGVRDSAKSVSREFGGDNEKKEGL